MKYIRELRMGPPKAGKTVAVVGTYPKPMLVFQFDSGGTDVIPSTPVAAKAGTLALDVTHSDIVKIQPSELAEWCKKKTEELPKVTLVDFAEQTRKLMVAEFVPLADAKPYNSFYTAVNNLVTVGCPWKTFVLDSVTGLCDSLLSFVAEKQSAWLTDARKWSPAVGGKALQHVAVMTNLPVHCVFLAHSHMEKNELTGEISIIPLGPNRLAEQIGALVSQYLYATNETGKLQVYTKPKGNVKAIGCRWPSDIPAVCDADFKSIYGKELQ
jgi:AAA domain